MKNIAAGLFTFAATLPMAAMAQTNVTVYGIVDMGVSLDRTGAPGTSTAARVNSGYMSPSRLGFTGSEDLGGGTRAVFTLEMGLDIDTGGFKTYAGSPTAPTPTNVTGFNRRSFMGLQGAWGTLTLGRDYTPFFWTHLATDTLGYGFYNNLGTYLQTTGTGTERAVRASNAVFYLSPTVAGFTGRLMYSAGAESFGGALPANAPTQSNAMWGVGGTYAQGPLLVSAAYQTVRLANVAAGALVGGTANRTDAVLGAKYNFGAFSLNAGVGQIDPPGTINTARHYWIGGTVRAGAGTVLAQLVQFRGDQNALLGLTTAQLSAAGPAPRATMLGLSYSYPLSKRTTAYLTAGRVLNNARAGMGMFAADNSVGGGTPGADPSGVGLGLRHAF